MKAKIMAGLLSAFVMVPVASFAQVPDAKSSSDATRDARGNDAKGGGPVSPSHATVPAPPGGVTGAGAATVGTTMGGTVRHGDSARDAR